MLQLYITVQVHVEYKYRYEAVSFFRGRVTFHTCVVYIFKDQRQGKYFDFLLLFQDNAATDISMGNKTLELH